MSRDEYCVHEVNYKMLLKDSVSGMIVKQVEVGSESCRDGICSISLSPSPSDRVYRINLTAQNIVGSSSSASFRDVICKSGRWWFL